MSDITKERTVLIKFHGDAVVPWTEVSMGHVCITRSADPALTDKQNMMIALGDFADVMLKEFGR
jgi:hypothetical protein